MARMQGSGLRIAPRASKGFTLVEALVVLGIMAVMAAIGVPGLSRFVAERRVHAAASDHAALLRGAQAEAIARNRVVEVLFTATAATAANGRAATAAPSADGPHWLARQDPPEPDAAAPATTRDPWVASRLAPADAAVRVEPGGLLRIAFTPTGRALDYGTPPGTAFTIPRTARFTDPRTGRRFCVYVLPGGSSRVCDPTRADGSPGACLPALPAGAC